MDGITADLTSLAEDLRAGVVTQVEAAERLQALAARIPAFVVRVEELNGGELLLYYLSGARKRQDALVEARQALGNEAPECVCIEITPARAGVAWRRDEPERRKAQRV